LSEISSEAEPFRLLLLARSSGMAKIDEPDGAAEGGGSGGPRHRPAARRAAGFDGKRVLVGAGARVLFYPTLLYNVVRNKLQPEFRWWDEVDEVSESVANPRFSWSFPSPLSSCGF